MREASKRKNDPDQLELSQEELKKMGFRILLDNTKVIEGENAKIYNYSTIGIWELEVDGNVIGINIKFLHQLQCLLTVLGIEFNDLTDS